MRAHLYPKSYINGSQWLGRVIYALNVSLERVLGRDIFLYVYGIPTYHIRIIPIPKICLTHANLSFNRHSNPVD